MTEQLQLVEVPLESPLTDRQAHALELIRQAGRAGIGSDELGERVHAWQGKHANGETCRWCRDAGLDLGRTLRRKGYVRAHRDGTWYALSGASNVDADSDYGVFPEGF